MQLSQAEINRILTAFERGGSAIEALRQSIERIEALLRRVAEGLR